MPNILFYQLHEVSDFFLSHKNLNLEVGEERQKLGEKFGELLNCSNPPPSF